MNAESPQFCSLLIRGAHILDPAEGSDMTGDILVVDGVIRAKSDPLPPGTPEIDARGCLLTPGFLDLHVHFREPGDTEAETLVSGGAAAIRGGFTRVVTMPNTRPPIDSPDAVRQQIAGCTGTRVLPSACLTRQRSGNEIADLPSLAQAGAVAFTDDGDTVADDAIMRRAMRAAAALGLPVMDHAILPGLSAGGVIRSGALAERLGLPVLPPEAEVAAVERDIRLACETGCRVHIQHISTSGAVRAVRRAIAAGLPVSAEATPHHLALSVEDISDDDANFKMNPPLGNREDVAALRAAVRDGAIAAFATDHAPHRSELKAKGFLAAPFGVIGLETAAAVTYAVMVREAGLSPLEWARRWTSGPLAILGLPPPSLAPDTIADLALFDMRTSWTVSEADFASRSRNSPFIGHTLPLRPILTILEGRMAWRKDGI